MISITKKEIDNGATYKMEIFRNGKCTWEYTTKVDGNISEQQRDRIAQLKLIREFWDDVEMDDFYELMDLIPMYIEKDK